METNLKGFITSLPINEDTQLYTIIKLRQQAIDRLDGLVNIALDVNTSWQEKTDCGDAILKEQKTICFCNIAAIRYYN